MGTENIFYAIMLYDVFVEAHELRTIIAKVALYRLKKVASWHYLFEMVLCGGKVLVAVSV